MAAMNSAMAFDSAPANNSNGPAATDAPDQEPDPNDPQEGAEGETLSLSMFPKPPMVGDKVTLEVKSVDSENGTVEVAMPGSKPGSGIMEKAAAFDESA